jgi:hypothetical protein
VDSEHGASIARRPAVGPGLVDTCRASAIIAEGSGEIAMKKTYSKPAFVKKGKLSAVTANGSTSATM